MPLTGDSMKNFNMMCRVIFIALMLQFMLTVQHLHAGTQPNGSIPADGSTISGSPNRVAVWFDRPTRVTLLEVISPRGVVVPLKQMPDERARARFETRLARELTPGTYTMRWSGIAADGVVTANEISFTVEPGC